mgnify:CR=1 FL=1|jgi:3'-phosphoadenosine 5'-phosphosulfate sulfotransferase (PAPS reductase)/FAD synthetase
MKVAWFSAGVTSAVATYYAINEYDDVTPVFIETGSHHPDNERFINECEEWFRCKIQTIQHKDLQNIYDVFKHKQFINSPYGAPCTALLKKQVRMQFEDKHKIDNQFFGFEYEPKEIQRATRFKRDYQYTNALFPLINKKLNKKDCIDILEDNEIGLPMMYKLGYSNNNCIGCVKGGMGYFNKIRIDFPEVFNKTAKLERELGASCINGVFLDELDPNRGRMSKPLVESCGVFCDS